MSLETKKIVNLKASLVSKSKKHSGIIENLSKDSIYLRAVTINPVSDFIPGEFFEIHFQSNSGENISLPGKVKWSYETPPHGITKSIGIEILEKNPGYEKLFKTL
jgi:hypothetical protein